jgi:hypothetical protein
MCAVCFTYSTVEARENFFLKKKREHLSKWVEFSDKLYYSTTAPDTSLFFSNLGLHIRATLNLNNLRWWQADEDSSARNDLCTSYSWHESRCMYLQNFQGENGTRGQGFQVRLPNKQKNHSSSPALISNSSLVDSIFTRTIPRSHSELPTNISLLALILSACLNTLKR